MENNGVYATSFSLSVGDVSEVPILYGEEGSQEAERILD